VPSPPRGYWVKKQTDNPVKRIRFVNTADPRDERIVIQDGRKPDLPEPVKKILDEARSSRLKAVVATPVGRKNMIGVGPDHPVAGTGAGGGKDAVKSTDRVNWLRPGHTGQGA
jgi:hypothetical protein